MMGSHYVYLHCKPDGTPFYVGEGAMKRVKKIIGARNHLHRAVVDEYGKENILIYAFPCDSKEEAVETEILWIEKLRNDGIVLANISNGGAGFNGITHSAETRAALSKIKSGRPVSEAHKAAIRATLTGRKMPPEQRAAMAEGIRKKWECPEFRERMSAIHKERWARRKSLKQNGAHPC